MTTQHTPGPWKTGKRHPARVISEDGFIAACSCFEDDDTNPTPEEISNATLCAAAPEILQALEALTEWGCTHTSPLDPNSPHALLIAARAAIDKAKS